MENFTIKQKFTGLEKSEYRERLNSYIKRLKKETKKMNTPRFGSKFFNYKVDH